MKVVSFGPARSSVVNISLHGLPGVYSRQNLEIAEKIVEVSGDRTEAFLYSGLGVAPGVFSFKSCLREVEARMAEIVAEDKDISIRLIGHSWGGYLALRMAAIYRDRVEKLVLMSPLLELPNEERALEGLKGYKNDHPELNFADIDLMLGELASLKTENSSYDLIDDLPETIDVLFLQAKNDPVTLDQNALKALEIFKRPPIFEFVATDHSFVEDRPRLAQRIAEFIVNNRAPNR